MSLLTLGLSSLQGAVSKEMNSVEANDLEMTSHFVGSLTADVLLYPIETVLHRYRYISMHISYSKSVDECVVNIVNYKFLLC